MQLISPPFLFFAAITLAVYYLLARKAQNIWLLAASYFFYVTISPQYALVLIAVTILNFYIGKKAASRAWLALGVGLNLVSFAALKLLSGPYGPRLLPVPPEALSLLLPIGFSFYILQAISYLIDIHNRQADSADDLVDFALYLTYFPKMLAGPIERPARFISDLRAVRRVDASALARGGGLILVGLLRKIIIADRLTSFLPPTIFSDPAAFSSLEKLIWLLVFTFGLYNDFAGYTSIVRGLSALFGIELSPNFRQPFFANSLSDFWTRWHISLSFWLRDYIFFPTRRWLIQRRWPQLPTILLPPLLTMLASGFWHGAYASVMVWGTLHGLYLVAEQLFKSSRPPSRIKDALSVLTVFSITTLTLIPFAASSLRTALVYFSGLFDFTTQITSTIPFIDLFAAALFTLWLDWQASRHAADAFFTKWTPRARAWGLVAALWLLIIFLGPQANVVTFVYQGF
ncbi:MAG: MBOAT family protein [Anaerolineaceae bacterium]|nr:MAG: MBOAT family protein [Anaerolineaceae bacterium]